MEQKLKDKLSSLKLIVADVDGTLTDGYKYYSAEGQVMKRFSVRDGLGMVLLEEIGIKTAILTTDNSPIVESRMRDLRVVEVVQGSKSKDKGFLEICGRCDIKPENAAMLGDDMNDLHAFEVAGLKVSTADAHYTVMDAADLTLDTKGGEGAFRELADKIFEAKGIKPTLKKNW
ncbi:MAG: HAD family hydrolase [Candidatus Kapaibacteriales bacterium]